ncbi:MAG: SRPBCC family protein [Dehalococcoidales bacterium]|nr:SRPBCC family protein [Dehalococcoidales bacterium]
MKIQKSIEISAEAENIWPFLVEPANIMQWCSTVRRILHTSEQRSGLWTPFYFEERAVGRLMKLHFVVTEWIVNRSVAFKMTSGNLVRGYEQRYTMEPSSTGIRFTCFENVTLPFGILGKFVELFRKPISEAHLERMLVKLKSLAEACVPGMNSMKHQ